VQTSPCIYPIRRDSVKKISTRSTVGSNGDANDSTDGVMFSRIWGFILILTAVAITPAPTFAEATSNEFGFMRSAYGGEVRALVIGIDAYRHVRPLKGAVADAWDIASSLRRVGVQDVTDLIDANN